MNVASSQLSEARSPSFVQPKVSQADMSHEEINELSSEGDCYESSFKMALSFHQVKEAVENGTGSAVDRAQYLKRGLKNEIFIFHGYATSPKGRDAGKRIHHAWIEVGDVVFETQGGTARDHPRGFYYGLFSIYPNERYTALEALNYVTAKPGVLDYSPWRGRGEDICAPR